MIKFQLDNLPVQGETYSLFGEMNNSDYFYDELKSAADELISRFGSPERLLSEITAASKRKKYLKNILKNGDDNNIAAFILRKSKSLFSQDTSAIHIHLKNRSLKECFDKTLSLSEEQMHLFMFELELTNRIYKTDFLRSDYKIALLPHCLRDLERTCLSVKDEIDKYCKGCSKHCFVNAVSVILRDNNINPYIWMEADLQKLFSIWKKERRSFGVLGIACIPELINGMRMCRKHKIPVIGIPLNANRCARWMGEFHHNSINLNKVLQLISSNR